MYTQPAYSQPISLTQSTESNVYWLFSLAMGLTVCGVYAGAQFAPFAVSTGLYIVLFLVQLGLIFTARFWANTSPLNYVMFGIFPLISGFTITPMIMSLLVNYVNGATILLNALGATACMSGAAAVFARTTSVNLGFLGKGLLFAVIGLIIVGIAQIFIPALQTSQFELMISGAGVIIFGMFLAYDVQRIAQLGQAGANPVMLALSLYLDVFNMFLYLLRFMTILSGERR